MTMPRPGRAPLGTPYPSWRDNDLVATELDYWVKYLETDPDGFRKIRALMGARVAELRRAAAAR